MIQVEIDRGRRVQSWPRRWRRLFPFLFLLMMTMQIDKINISFMFVNRPFATQFGLISSPTRLAFLTGGFLLCYGAFGLLWGPVIQRWGGRRVAVAGMLAWGVVMALHAVSRTYAELAALRLALGVIEAFAVPLMAWYSAQWLPFGERARGQAAWTVGITAGSIITPLLIEWLLKTVGWQNTFWVSAALPLIPLGYLLALVPETPRQVAGFPAEELEVIEQGTLVRQLDQLRIPTRSESVFHFRDTVRNYRVWLIALIDLGATAGFYGLTTFGPKYLTQVLHFPVTNMSVVISAGAVVGGLGALLLASWSDRVKRRGWFGFGNFLAGALFLSLVLVLPAGLAGACYALASATATAALVIIWSLPHAVAEREAIASTVGLASAVGITLSGLITISMGGIIGAANGNYTPGFLLILLFYLLAAVASGILGAQRY